MAMRNTAVSKLYKYLHDKTCLCSMNEAGSLRGLSEFESWLRESRDGDGDTDASRCVKEQEKTAVEDASVDSMKKDDGDEGTPDETFGQTLRVCGSDCSRAQLKATTHEHTLQEGVAENPFQQDEDCHLDQQLPKYEKSKHPKEEGEAHVQMPSPSPESAKQSPTQRVPCQEQPETMNVCEEDGREKIRCKWAGVGTDAREEESWAAASRDWTLLCLTIGKHLFEATHCEHVLRLQSQMIGQGSLLEELGRLMLSEDGLIVFMTCKMTMAVLSSTAIDKETVASFLQHHLHCSFSTIKTALQQAGHHGHHGLSSFSSSQHQQADPPLNQGQIHVHRNRESPVNHGRIDSGQLNPGQTNQGQDNSSQVIQGQADSGQHRLRWANKCEVSSGQVGGPDGFPVNLSKLKPGRLNRSKVRLGQVNRAVFTFDLCRLFLRKVGDEESQQSKGECVGMQGSPTCKVSRLSAGQWLGRLKDLQADVTRLLYRNVPDIFEVFTHPTLSAGEPHKPPRVNIDKDTLLMLASLLDLVHALIKHGKADQHWPSITSKLLFPLMDLLQGCCHDLIILKKILDIFILLTDQSAATVARSSQSHSSDHSSVILDGDVITVATTFVSMVVGGEFFDCIPYRNGPIGFGGGNFHLGGLDNEGEDLEFGDRPLLRTLCRATFSAMKILLTCDSSVRNSVEADVGKCLQILTQYVCCKLHLDISAGVSNWLFELFADQDDSLIWAMHCTLDLHKAARSLQPPGTLLTGQLDPHRIFVRFLDTVAYDPSVLLDLLISSETMFLEYLVQYLHAILRDWDSFCHSHQEVTFEASSKNRSEQFHFDVPDDRNCEKKCIDAGNGNKASVEEKQHLADRENSRTYCEREKVVGENAPETKRRRTEMQRDTEAGTLLDAGSYSVSRQATASTQAEKEFSRRLTDAEGSLTEMKKTLVNKLSPKSSQDLSSNQNADKMLSSRTNNVSRSLDDTMTTLIRLRFSIKKISSSNLFPYPVSPLLKLLERVESMYEGVE